MPTDTQTGNLKDYSNHHISDHQKFLEKNNEKDQYISTKQKPKLIKKRNQKNPQGINEENMRF